MVHNMMAAARYHARFLMRPSFFNVSPDQSRYFSVSTKNQSELATVKEIRCSLTDGASVALSGWVKSVRHHKTVSFIELNDGSCLADAQIVVGSELAKGLYTGCSVKISGSLVPSPVKGAAMTNAGGSDSSSQKQGAFEVHANKLELLGECDPQSYPLQKKGHSLDFLREIGHLRARSNTFGAVMRIRNAATHGIHDFFQRLNFIQVHTPILTSNDCEGAGELFQVSTLKHDATVTPVHEPSANISQASGSGRVANCSGEGEHDPRPPAGFFGSPAYLTVSGQLHAEMFACALSKVYSFGPTFRAENSNTPRHLAEFWMLEPEVAFSSRDDALRLAEGCIKHTIQNVLNRCEDDILFFSKLFDRGAMERALKTVEKPFAVISYADAILVLQRSEANHKFSIKPSWDLGLATEHEKFLAEKHFGGPVFVTDYPTEQKPFYMRLNDADGGRTVACFDLLVPGIGELIGGSAREERFDVLRWRMQRLGLCTGAERVEQIGVAGDQNGAYNETELTSRFPCAAALLPPLRAHEALPIHSSESSSSGCAPHAGTESNSRTSSMAWYLDLRRYGTVPHAGWGLGFERLILYLTGLDNIRDAIPIPRAPGSIRF